MTKKRSGYIKLLEIRGIPLFVHWSFLQGGLLIFILAGFRLRETLYCWMLYALLIAIHEFGHVAAARFFRLKVYNIEMSGLGGLCLVQPPRRAREIFFVYAAGLLTQLILLAIAIAYYSFWRLPASLFGLCVIKIFIFVNFILLVVNIIPRKTPRGLDTDGLVLWKLFLHVFRGHPSPFQEHISRIFPSDTRLFSIKEFVPKDFTIGVEILNDDTTPMEFVVTNLMQYLDLEQDGAMSLMLVIHKEGGALIPLPTIEKANSAAEGISREARALGYNFVCRAVEKVC